jgi:VirE N-terminal domain/D5 N terminal like
MAFETTDRLTNSSPSDPQKKARTASSDIPPDENPSRLVSVFYRIDDTKPAINNVSQPRDMPFEDVIKIIRSPEYKTACEDVRAAHQQGGKPAANEAKVKLLPYYTPTGTCTYRSIEGFDQSSRICHGDIDISDITARNVAAEIARIRECLIADPRTVFVHSSPTGGLKFGFAIPVVTDNEEYKRYWLALEHYMKREYGVKIDSKCKDVAHACFMAHDPEAFYNERAQTFAQTRDEPAAKAKTTEEPDVASNGHILDDDDVIKHTLSAPNGEKVRALLEGDVSGYDSQSEADIALCCYIARYTKDHEQIDRIFRRSGLMRSKWARDDYRAATIAKAIEFCEETYTGRAKSDDGRQNSDLKRFRSMLGQSYYGDASSSRHFVKEYGIDLRFSYEREKWFLYERGVWNLDKRGRVIALVKRLSDDIGRASKQWLAEAKAANDDDEIDRAEAFCKYAKTLSKLSTRKSVLEDSESEPGISILLDDMNQHPMLLNCPNGVIDLGTGEILPHIRTDLRITVL